MEGLKPWSSRDDSVESISNHDNDGSLTSSDSMIEAHRKHTGLPLARLILKGVSGRSRDPRHLIVGNAQMVAILLNSSGELRSAGHVRITPIACPLISRPHDLTDAG
jgi:hypothetical protein